MRSQKGSPYWIRVGNRSRIKTDRSPDLELATAKMDKYSLVLSNELVE
jgi:hypothetical protein